MSDEPSGRTRSACRTRADSDYVQQSATIRVSKCQLLLFSEPFGLGLLVELLTRGVAAAILADARDFCM